MLTTLRVGRDLTGEVRVTSFSEDLSYFMPILILMNLVMRSWRLE